MNPTSFPLHWSCDPQAKVTDSSVKCQKSTAPTSMAGMKNLNDKFACTVRLHLKFLPYKTASQLASWKNRTDYIHPYVLTWIKKNKAKQTKPQVEICQWSQNLKKNFVWLLSNQELSSHSTVECLLLQCPHTLSRDALCIKTEHHFACLFLFCFVAILHWGLPNIHCTWTTHTPITCITWMEAPMFFSFT